MRHYKIEEIKTIRKIICNKCGKEIEEGKKYCEECKRKEEIKSEVVINTSALKEEKPKKAMGTAGILSIIFGSVAFGSRFLTWLPNRWNA